MLAKKLESKLAGSLNVIIGEFVNFLVGFDVVVVVVAAVVVVGILSFGCSNSGILKVRMGELVERLVVLIVVVVVVVVVVDVVVLVVVVVVSVVVIVVVGTVVDETLWLRKRGTLKFSIGE